MSNLQTKFLHLFTVIPSDVKAEVTSLAGNRRTVDGPATILNLTNTVRPFERHVLTADQAATVTDENGNTTEVKGPTVVHVHPDGDIENHTFHPLQPHEAMVLTDKDGKATIYVGTGYEGTTGDTIRKVPQVEEKPLDTVHLFKWTGNKDANSELKAPGMLQFTTLRLQQTQTWFEVSARTRDGIIMKLNFMLFLAFTDVAKLLDNDDPMGVMFNSVNAAVLKKMGETTFDEFRKDPAGSVETAAKDAGRERLAKLGIEIEGATLRLWTPVDRGVEQLMAQEASTTARSAVAEAEHQANLKAITNKLAELTKQKELDAALNEQATNTGKRSALELKGFVEGLREDALFKDDAEALGRVVNLREVAKADNLTVTQESLYKAAA